VDSDGVPIAAVGVSIQLDALTIPGRTDLAVRFAIPVPVAGHRYDVRAQYAILPLVEGENGTVTVPRR
jgi:hypothetical protein